MEEVPRDSYTLCQLLIEEDLLNIPIEKQKRKVLELMAKHEPTNPALQFELERLKEMNGLNMFDEAKLVNAVILKQIEEEEKKYKKAEKYIPLSQVSPFL